MPDLVAPVVPAGRLRGQIQPELFIDELTLRPWRSVDAPAVVRAYQDPAVQQWHVRTMSDHEAEEWVAAWPERWAAETGAGWAVCNDQGLLARMSLRPLDLAEGIGEVAYWVLPEARGRGVAPRAERVYVDHCLTGPPAHDRACVRRWQRAAPPAPVLVRRQPPRAVARRMTWSGTRCTAPIFASQDKPGGGSPDGGAVTRGK